MTRILLLASAFNSLTQRVFAELRDRGHPVAVELALGGEDSRLTAAVHRHAPELVLAPMLTTAIPEAVWRAYLCLVVHPGPPGDRGPSSLDRAVQDGAERWGVTVLQAVAEMDAGPVWASADFAVPPGVGKSDLYRGEVSDAAMEAVLLAVERFASGGHVPRTPRTHTWQPYLRQEDRRIDWRRDATGTVLRKLRAADSHPGVLDAFLGGEWYLHGGHPEHRLTGPPGEVLATRGGAVCRATVDGAVWIPQLRPRRTPGGPATYKLPAARALGDRLPAVPDLTDPAGLPDPTGLLATPEPTDPTEPTGRSVRPNPTGLLATPEATDPTDPDPTDLAKPGPTGTPEPAARRPGPTGTPDLPNPPDPPDTPEITGPTTRAGLPHRPHLPHRPVPADSPAWPDIRYEERGAVGFLRFTFPGGAMGTDHCRRLLAAYRLARTRPVDVLVLGGARDFFSNGIHLGLIEAAADPAAESLANIEAIDDLAEEILTTTDRLVVSAVAGNAAAGGVMLALAADEVWCRAGTVLNPHYRLMGLYGSEFWTYTLPRRVGVRAAERLTDRALPVSAAHARSLGLVDRVLECGPADFAGEVARTAERLARSGGLAARLGEKKAARQRDEEVRPLRAYRAAELERMRAVFDDPAAPYHTLRSDFVHKRRPDRTPEHLTAEPSPHATCPNCG